MLEPQLHLSLQCPAPETGFSKITLGHGSGGLLTHRLLEEGVFSLFANPFLDTHDDGAVININGKTAFTTDSFVVSPIFFPGGNIGELAVNGTVNDLTMCGAIPKYISTAFIIEEGLSVDYFWEILLGIKTAAEQAGVQIITGDTKVVEKGKGDQIFITTTGIGEVHPNCNMEAQLIEPGDAIIISGSIANHGMAIMSVREGMEFETDILSDTTSLVGPVSEMMDYSGKSVKIMRDPTRGGVATALNEIAHSANLGIEINEKDIPIKETTHSACEMLGFDPLYVANEGIFLAVVKNDMANNIVSLLKNNPTSRDAAILGKVVDDHHSRVVMNCAMGGRRVVNMLPGDQLPRIC